MKYLTILENGVVWPSIRERDIIVAITDGIIRVGKYNKNKYLDNLFYLDSPSNEDDLISEIVEYIRIKNENLLIIKNLDVLFVCPKKISAKFVWNPNKLICEVI